MSQTPNEFYADRGLVRTSITFRPETIQFLKEEIDRRNEGLSKNDVKLTQGELVDAFCALLGESDNIKQLLDDKIESIKMEKIKARQDLLAKKKRDKAIAKRDKLNEIIGQ